MRPDLTETQIGGAHDPEPHLIPLVIQAAGGDRAEVCIFGTDYATPDGTAICDYIHVEDLAQAHILALRHLANGKESEAFNLGTGRGYGVRDMITAVENHSGQKVSTNEKGGARAMPNALLRAPRERAKSLAGVLLTASNRSLHQHGLGKSANRRSRCPF